MELFSEIYGLYYRIVTDILNRAPLSRAEAQQAILESGFAESVLYLIPRLFDEHAWPLLEGKDGSYTSRLNHPVRLPVTLLELRWLKAVLADPRARLFLSDSELVRLHALLFEVPPLYDPADFVYFDRYRDGDDYYSYGYIRHFRQVITALREQAPVRITYQSGPHAGGVQIHSGCFLPLKLEYSEKNDKFRAYCAEVRDGRPVRYATINIGRIQQISSTNERCRIRRNSLAAWFARNRSAEPIVAEIYPERNAVERFLLEFSAYEKQSEFDETSGICRVRLWYPIPDETELLIRILGFGPAVRVLGPERFVRQIRERVQAQARLLRETALEKAEKRGEL